MVGTVLENGSSAAPCVSNGDTENSTHVLKQRNGIRKGFLNNQKPHIVEIPMLEPDQVDVEPLPEYIPTFSQASPPSLVAVDTTSMNLQWKAVVQTGLSVSPPQGTDFPPCSIAYSLQMQQVSCYAVFVKAFATADTDTTTPLQVETRSTATGAELAEMCKFDKWSEVYKGTDLITQVPPVLVPAKKLINHRSLWHKQL